MKVFLKTVRFLLLFISAWSLAQDPAYVVTTNVAMTPSPVAAGNDLTVSAVITPYNQASNIIASFHWSTNGLDYDYVYMTNWAGTNYSTAPDAVTKIDAAGTLLSYYLFIEYQGAVSNYLTAYWPPSAPATPASTVTYPKMLKSNYSSMRITNDFTANLYLCDDYLWMGVKSKGSYSSPTLQFISGTSKWGDPEQSKFDLPLFSTAQQGNWTFQIAGTITGHLLFLFNDSNLQYTAQLCEYVNFDTWEIIFPKNDTNDENWQIYAGRTTKLNETGKAFQEEGRALVLPSGGSLKSPYLSQGIGLVSFRYRNFQDDGSLPSSWILEKSIDGTNDWIKVSECSDIQTPIYQCFSTSIAETTSRYFRIVNTSVNQLLLDEVIATKPGAIVTLSNPQKNGVNNYTGEPLDVSIDFTASGGATNLKCYIFWLSEDAENFTVTPMVSTGNTFYGTIPATMPGELEYYFKCEYDGVNAGPVFYPNGYSLFHTSTTNLASYRHEDFSWPAQKTTFATWTNMEWVVKYGVVRGAFINISAPLSSPYACWLTNLLSSSIDPSVTSPNITGGVGTVFFSSQTRFAETQTVAVMYSFDGQAWFTNNTVVVSPPATWSTKSSFLNISSNCYIRLQKITDGGENNEYLGLDDIAITPPSADILITNVYLTPGYPMTGDAVNVFCDINSVYTNRYPAYDLRPKLCYKQTGQPWKTNTMTQCGSGTYTAPLPRSYAPLLTEYYIRCDFAGYHYTNANITSKPGARFYPGAPERSEEPLSYLSYVPRRWQSDYESVSVSSSVGNVSMILAGENTWQGSIKPTPGTTNIFLSFVGSKHFTGSGYSQQLDVYGKDVQDIFDTPLTGYASEGNSNVVIMLDTQSQSEIIFRFNTDTKAYDVRRGISQNFNNFYANSNFFNKATDIADISIYENNFNSWPTQSIYLARVALDLEEFDRGWLDDGPPTDYYWGQYNRGTVGWLVSNVWVWYEQGLPSATTNFSGRLHPDIDGKAGAVWPHFDTQTKGLRDLTWDVRTGWDDLNPLVYSGALALSNYVVDLNWRSYHTGPDESAISILAPYINSTNYYAFDIVRTNRTQIRLRRRLVKNGNTTVLDDGLQSSDTSFTQNDLSASYYISGNEGALYQILHFITPNRMERGKVHVPPDIAFTTNTFAISTINSDIWIKRIAVRYADLEYFRGYAVPGGVTERNGWLFVNASIANPDTGYALLANNTTNAYVRTANLAHYNGGISNFYLTARTASGTNSTLVIEGSPNGTIWTPIAQMTGISDSWAGKSTNIVDGLSGYNYIRVRAFNTNNQIRITIMETTAKDPAYVVENFSVPPAQDLTPFNSYWQTNKPLPGLHASYWSGKNFETLKVVRIDQHINFNWGSSGPAPGEVPTTNWSARWTGYIRPDYTDEYTFQASISGGGVILWINDNLIISNWPSAWSFFSTNINLTKGVSYPIRMDFYQETGWTTAYLKWKTKETNAIPEYELVHPFNLSTPTNTFVYYRPSYTGPEARYQLQIAHVTDPNDMYDRTRPLNESYWSNAPPCAKTDHPSLYAISNINFETFSHTFEFWDKLFVRLKNVSPDANVFVDNLKLSSWRATNNMTIDAYSLKEGWVAEHEPRNNVLELWRSKADPSSNQCVEISTGTNGLGAGFFDFRGNATDIVFQVELGASATNIFTTNVVYVTHTNWAAYTLDINSPTTSFIRVTHITNPTSNKNAILYIDNMIVTDYKIPDDKAWDVYNVLITSHEPDRKFDLGSVPDDAYKTAYLNNHPTNRVIEGENFTNSLAFIQSAKITEGIGEISFWYRNWENHTPPGRLYIYACNLPDQSPADWILLDILDVSSPKYQFYRNDYYDLTNFFVRIYAESNAPNSRICIDNITILEPLAATLKTIKIDTIPTIPLHTGSIKFGLELGQYRMHPSNISARLYYHLGTDKWGNVENNWDTSQNVLYFDTVVWSNSSGMRLETSSGIPPQPIDQVVQYYPFVTFTGLHSDKSSPYGKNYQDHQTGFTHPSHYHPVNLNYNQTATNPYCFVFSCLPRAVWINEFNYVGGGVAYKTQDKTNEFIELCGPAGTIITNWTIQLLNTDGSVYLANTITPGFTLPNDANGFGFFVLGDQDMPSANMTFEEDKNEITIQESGGIRLIRSMGAHEYSIAYGSDSGYTNLVNAGFEYVGKKFSSALSSIFLTGYGPGYEYLTWVNGVNKSYTPGRFNIGQSPIIIRFTDSWIAGNKTYLVFTSSCENDIVPTPYYRTNMLEEYWTPVSGSSYDWAQESNVYTQSFDNLTDSPSYFFKIVTQ